MILLESEIVNNIEDIVLLDDKVYIKLMNTEQKILVTELIDYVYIIGFKKCYAITMDKNYSYNWSNDIENNKIKLTITKVL